MDYRDAMLGTDQKIVDMVKAVQILPVISPLLYCIVYLLTVNEITKLYIYMYVRT